MKDLTPEERRKIFEEENARIEKEAKETRDFQIKEQKKEEDKTPKGCIGCFAVIILIILISFFSQMAQINNPTPSSSSSKQWFSGGTLHNATVAQWKNATYKNKLATAGDWLAATKWNGYLNSPDDFNNLKVKARMLVDAVDEVVAETDMKSMKVTEIAAAIITMSNDLGPF
jgi:pyruvate/2-oxoacid:ferredoxin oxidoreductase beta subunit